MRINEYNQMMNYLTRPGTPKQRAEYNVGNKVKPYYKDANFNNELYGFEKKVIKHINKEFHL